MATIPVEKSILEDLVNTKLNFITEKINAILKKWNTTNIEKFLENAQSGALQEAELDAISLTNLIDRRNEYLKYQVEWSSDT